MSDATAKPEIAPPPPRAAGLLARFDGPKALLAAAARMRQEGYTRFDAMSPLPVHGMERAIGIRPTPLPWLVLAAGVAGAAAALLLQWWTNAVDYPLIISGKPLFSLPANIPIVFELIVLFAALAAFGGTLVLNRLPQFWHPAFGGGQFVRVTTDGFFIFVDAADRNYDEAALRRLARSLGAADVETCFDPPGGRSLPKATVWIALVAVLLSVLPVLWIARSRLLKSPTPRLEIFSDMDFQPKYKAQAASGLFADGRAMRPPVPGAVRWGGLEADDHFYRGESGGHWATTFPMTPDRALMERGQERFNIYCATCHGWIGEGDGPTSLRAAKRDQQAIEAGGKPTWVTPISLQAQAIREESVGELFQVITNGRRKMPSYAAQIPPRDRWAIILYIRALQLSQDATIQDVPADKRLQLR
jgi:mono/diheme cytochrome c family protein